MGRFGTTLEAWRPAPTPRPFDLFDGILCINLDTEARRWRQARRRYELLGIDGRVERFPAVATPDDHHVGCALSWRGLIAEADRRGYDRVLGLEDDTLFLDRTVEVLADAFAQLAGLRWDLLYLGGALHGEPTAAVDGRPALRRCGWIACAHAVAVHRRAFPRILADLPADEAAMRARLPDHGGAVDQYLAQMSADGELTALLVQPQVAVQAELLPLPYGEFEPAEHYCI